MIERTIHFRCHTCETEESICLTSEQHDIVADAIDRNEEPETVKRMICNFVTGLYDAIHHPSVEIFYREYDNEKKYGSDPELDDDAPLDI